MNYPVPAVFYRLPKCRVMGFSGNIDSYDSIDGPVLLQQGVMILMFHQMAATAGQGAVTVTWVRLGGYSKVVREK